MRFISIVRVLNKNDEAAQENQQAQTSFYQTLTQNYKTDFSDFEGAIDNLNKVINPIVNAGPGQYGFDATEDSAIRSSAIDQDAASAQNAQQATEQQIKAANGGVNVMPTGAADQLRQEANVDAAKKTSSDQNAITQAGYAQGNANYQGALSAKLSSTNMMNPNAFAGSVSSAGNSATGAVNAATSAEQASDSWMQMVGGALGGASSALTAKFVK